MRIVRREKSGVVDVQKCFVGGDSDVPAPRTWALVACDLCVSVNAVYPRRQLTADLYWADAAMVVTGGSARMPAAGTCQLMSSAPAACVRCVVTPICGTVQQAAALALLDARAVSAALLRGRGLCAGRRCVFHCATLPLARRLGVQRLRVRTGGRCSGGRPSVCFVSSSTIIEVADVLTVDQVQFLDRQLPATGHRAARRRLARIVRRIAAAPPSAAVDDVAAPPSAAVDAAAPPSAAVDDVAAPPSAAVDAAASPSAAVDDTAAPPSAAVDDVAAPPSAAAVDGVDADSFYSVLLLGPAGCGKATLVQSVAQTAGVFTLTISCTDLHGADAETLLRHRFEEAASYANRTAALVLLLRGVDQLQLPSSSSSPSSSSPAAGATIVHQLLHWLRVAHSWRRTLLVATVSAPQHLSPLLRTANSFGTEIHLNVGCAEDRRAHLTQLLRDVQLDDDVSVAELAAATPGYTVADLHALLREAMFSSGRCVGGGRLTSADVRGALHVVAPSPLKGAPGAVPCPPLDWRRLAGLDAVRRRLLACLVTPLTDPAGYRRLGVPAPRGLLLYGPPGCAKTSLVRAAASSCRAAFLSVGAAEIFSPYVGDAERNIVELFTHARMVAPAVIFFDELDALVGTRSKGQQAGGVQAKVLSALLNEMDGIGIKSDNMGVECPVFVVGATNRRDLIDEALLRPGRLDQHVHVPLPDTAARRDILALYTDDMPLSDCVDLDELAARTGSCSGADLKQLCNQAGLTALSDDMHAQLVTSSHFIRALASR